MKSGNGMTLLVLFLLIGGYLLWRALSGGSPVLYFLSALSFGMAIGALQNLRKGKDR